MADNIKVVIKVRPLIKREIDDSLQKQWTVSDNTIFPTGQQFGREGMGEFTFDYVFDDESLTQDVYEKVARPIVEAAVGGMNGTIFAYGQTSSGKTYTMMGDACSPGVIPLAVSNIFHAIESKVDRDFLLRVSYIEIYNEKIRDLLDVTKTDLKIHEDHTGQVTVKCHEEVTSKSSQVLEVMKRGDKNRSTGETQMNERSSRSHTIFIIIIESRRHVMPGEEEEDSVNVSQLNLVDLAGSERPAQTGATHQRLREGGHINKSLHMLGNVIRQLSDAQGDTSRFISFRDSKLTRILQTSLGGNAKTGIICAVTPAVLDETYSTLKFAMCAKAIQNKPKINAVVSDATQIKTLTREMKYLQEELEKKNHLEVDNKRLQEQLALLRDKILMGGTEEVSVQRAAALRRRTWCAPQRPGLPAIQEHAFHGYPPLLHQVTPLVSRHQPQEQLALLRDKILMGGIEEVSTQLPAIQEHSFQRINFNNVQRLSNVTERNDDSFVTSRDSASSNREMVHEEIVILDDSGEEDTLANSRNTCFDPNCTEISHTALCKWKYRASKAEKELIQLEELTSLEKTCGPVEMELLQNICILRQEKQSADEKCDVFSQQTKLYTELQTQFENLTKDYEESCCKLTELTDLTQSIPAYKSEIQQLKVLLNSNNLEMDAIKLDLQSKITLIETLESRILEKGDNSDLQIQVENLTKDYEESRRKLTELTDLTQSIPAYESEIQQLKVLLSSNNLEMDAIKLELQSKITLIETMEARAHEEGNIFSQQTKLYSELQTQFENLTKDYEESTCKLTELTDLTQSISAYESENQLLKVLLNSNNLEMDAIKLELQSKITLIETLESRILEKGDNSDLQIQVENLTKDYEESCRKLTELTDLTQSIPAYESEIQQLKVLLSSNNLEMDAIKLELQSKITLIETMQSRILEKGDNSELQMQIENLTKDYEESRCKLTELIDLTQSIPAYKSEIEQLKVLLNSNNLEMDAIKSELQAKISLIESMEASNNSELQIQIENLTKDLEESCSKLVELTDLTQSIPTYESEILQLKALINSNNLEMDAIKLELQSKITLIQTMEACVPEKGENSELQIQIENLTKDLEESRSKLAELTDLTQSIPTYESEILQLKALLNSNNLEMDAIKLELQSKITLIETMEASAHEEGDILSQQTKLNSELQIQIENLTKDLEESHSKLAELTDLTQSIPTYESEILQLKALLNSNNLEMDAIKLELTAKITLMEACVPEKGDNSELQIQIENLTTDLEESRSKLAELTDLTQSIPTYDSEILQLKALLNSNNLEMEAIKLELQAKISLIESMEASNNSQLQIQIENLTKDLEESCSKLVELTDLTQSIPTYESEILQLKALLNSNDLEMDAIKLELQSKITLIETMEARAHEEGDILSQQTKLNSELQIQIENLTKDLEESHSKLAELTDLTQSIPTYESEILQLKALLNSNNLEMDAIKLELQAKITLIETMEACVPEKGDNSELQIQIENLTKDLEESRSKLAELTDLTQRIPTYDSEILQLKALLNSNNLEMDAIKLELQSKITLIETMEARAHEEGDILSQQTKLNSELQIQIENLTKDLEESHSKLAELTDLTQSIPTYESEILQLKALLNSNNLEMDAIKLELQAKNTLIETMEACVPEKGDNSELQIQIENLTKDLEESCSKLAELRDLTQSIPTYESEILQLKALLNSNNLELEAIKLELQAKITLIETMEACVHEKGDNSELQIQIENLTKDLEESRSKLAELTDLTQSIPTYENEILQLKALLNSNNLEMEAIKLELQAKITLIETMEACVPEKGDNSELQIQIENLTKDLEESRSKLAELRDLTESIPTYESEILQLKEQVARINEEKHESLLNVEWQTKTDKILIAQLETTITSMNQQITCYQQQLSEEKLNFQQKESDLKSMCENNIINSDEILALRESISILENERIELMNDCNTKSSQIAKLKQDLLDTVIQFSSISEIKEELPKNLDKIANEKTSIFPELMPILAKRKELEIALQESLVSNNLLKEKVLRLENTNDELKRLLYDIFVTISELDKIHHEKYTDVEITFSGSIIDDYMDVMKQSIHNILSLKSVLQTKLSLLECETFSTVIVGENTPGSKSILSVQTASEFVDISQVQDEGKLVSALDESKCVVDEFTCNHGLQDLEILISTLESHISDVYSRLEVQQQTVLTDVDTNTPININLEAKLTKIINMHNSLLQHIEELILSKIDDNEKLMEENLLLKSEIQQSVVEVKELVKEAEELQKKVLNQRSENEVSNAEYSLLNSRLTSVQHYHTNLHSFCNSTTSYLQLELTELMSLLQDPNQTERENTFYTDDFITPKKSCILETQTEDVSEKTPVSLMSNFTVDKFQCTDAASLIGIPEESDENLKTTCENLRCDLDSKCSEIRRLTEQLTDYESIKERYHQLQNEHESLSNELMDSLQEVDETKSKYQSLEKELFIVNECRKVSEEEIRLSEEQLKNMSDQNASLQQSLQRLTEVIEDKKKTFETALWEKEKHLEDNIVKHNEQLQTKLNMIIDFENKLSQLTETVAEREVLIDNISHKYEDEKKKSSLQITCLEEQIKTLHTENKKDKEAMFSLISNTEQLSCLLKEKDQEIIEMEKEISQLKTLSRSSTGCTDAASGVAPFNSVPEESDQSLKAACENLRCNLDSKCSEIKRLTDQLTDYESLKERYHQLQNEHESLSNELMDSLQEVDQTKSKCQSLEKELSMLNECRKVSKEEMQLSEEQLRKMSDKNASLEQSLQRFTEIIEVEKKTFETALWEKEKHLEDNIAKHNEQLQTKLNMIIDFENKLSQLTETVAEREVLIDNISCKYEDEKKKSSLQITCLEEQINSLRTEKKTFETALREKEKHLEDNVAKHNEQLQTKLNMIIDFENKLSQLTETVAEREVLIDNITHKYEDEKKKSSFQITGLEEQIKTLCTENKKDKEAMFSLISNTEQLSCLLKEKDQEIIEKEKEISQLKTLSRSSTGLEFELQKSHKELKNQKDFIQELQSKITSMEERTTKDAEKIRLESENSTLLSANTILQSRVADIQSELNALLKSSPKIRHDVQLKRQSLHDQQRSLVICNASIKQEDNDVSMEDCEMATESSNLKKNMEQLEWQLKAAQDRYEQLEQALIGSQQSLKHKAEEYARVVAAYQNLEVQMQEMRQHLVTLSSKNKQDASTNTNQKEDHESLMSLFVDRMTHDLLKDKHQVLQRANEDLRMRNKEQASELRRLLHSHQDNTLHSRLPKDSSKDPEKLMGEIKGLEQELKTWKEKLEDCEVKYKEQEDWEAKYKEQEDWEAKYKEQEDWEAKYKEMDVEYDVCVDELRQTIITYNKVFSEKLLIEAELKHVKGKLEEMQEGSPSWEVRRKRRSLYDANRGTIPTTVEASTNTIPEDHESLMSLFVDRMTHDLLKEKHQVLQRVNEDLRMRNKEQASELRRLLHSHQDNTVHTRLSKDSSKDSEKLKGEIKGLEQELKTWKEKLEECEAKYKEQEDWEAKYKEMDAEYDTCADELRQTIITYNKVFSEKLLVEAELKHVKGKLEEMQEGSPSWEVRRKRQSLYDANRGTSLTTVEASTNTIPDDFNRSRLQICEKCEPTRKNLQELQNKNMELESRLSLRPATIASSLSPHLVGSAIVQNHQLHEYMKENQILTAKAEKYKTFYLKYRNQIKKNDEK